MLGQTATELIRAGNGVSGVAIKDKHGHTLKLRTKLVVGADGRDSQIAKLAGVPARTTRTIASPMAATSRWWPRGRA